VQDGGPFPAQQQKTAEADKKDEAEMQHDNAVGKESLDHGNPGLLLSGLHCFTPAIFAARPAAHSPLTSMDA
jgi:hypothetical protein